MVIGVSFPSRMPVRGQLDVFSFSLIMISTLIFSFQVVGFAFGLSPLGLVGVILTVVGFVIWLLLNLVINPVPGSALRDAKTSQMEVGMILNGGLMSLAAILALNVSTTYFFPGEVVKLNVALASQGVNARLAAVNMAVGEEVVFRLALTTFFIYSMGAFLGIFTSAGVGVIFHSLRYGNEPLFLLIVGGSWVILGVVYYATKGRLSVTLIPHILLNFIATPGPGQFIIPGVSS